MNKSLKIEHIASKKKARLPTGSFYFMYSELRDILIWHVT